MRIWKYIKNKENQELESNTQKENKQEKIIQEEETKSREESSENNQNQEKNNQAKAEYQQSEKEPTESAQQENQSNSSGQENSSQEETKDQQAGQNSQGEGSSSQESSETESNQGRSSSQEEAESQSTEQNSQGESSSSPESSESECNQESSSSQEETESQSTEQNSQGESSSSQKSSELESNQESPSSQEETESQPTEQSTQKAESSSNQEETSREKTEGEQSEKKSKESAQQESEENKTNQREEYSPTIEELEDRKRKLQSLHDKLQDYALKKAQEEKKQKLRIKNHPQKEEVTESEENEETPPRNTEFLNQLQELPSFEDREKGPGYALDTKSFTQLPESLIRTLINKFLNQRFCKKKTDLNTRNNSLEKTEGFYKWDVKKVIIHSKTHQLNKVLNDKYGYDYAEGQGENVPLSFYFDLSGSMSKYSNMLATIAIELLKKNVKVLIGFNERVNIQIEKIDPRVDLETLGRVIKSAGYYSLTEYSKHLIKDSKVQFKFVNRNIDNYLIERSAEKCVVFSDFDPLQQVKNLSQKVETYWFCFESDLEKKDLQGYNGFLYQVKTPEDILEGLIKVSDKNFETLVYIDNPKILRKKGP